MTVKDTLSLLRLFNNSEGMNTLRKEGVPGSTISKLSFFGISGIANVLCCIKVAKYYELSKNDVVATVLTDSAEMYASRICELDSGFNSYSATDADRAFYNCLIGQKTDNILELKYAERIRVHNLKYYTWVEEQGKTVEKLDAQWYDNDYWTDMYSQVTAIGDLIKEFNYYVL